MPARSLPDTLAALLVAFAPCFTARTFPTFRRVWTGYRWEGRPRRRP